MNGPRALLFNVLFFAWTVLVHVACLPLLVLPRRAVVAAARTWACGSLWLLAKVCALRHQVRGMANLPAEPCILAAKHQSAWDTLIFWLLVDRPAYVFKKELLRLPLFGWYLSRTGSIAVDRAGGAAALRRLVESARRALAERRHIVIFPEGTRVAPGQHRPYHPGVTALYTKLGVPVVPVAVNSGLFWGRRSFLKRPGRITLEFLPPIRAGLTRREFAAELELRIEGASARLLAEA